uniref:HAT C-terminal dimerisation domain-containing protein n=1 Tax=Ditylenchus dipsaci TaxID=166011 RepID=A0A915EDX8_9BILA
MDKREDKKMPEIPGNNDFILIRHLLDVLRIYDKETKRLSRETSTCSAILPTLKQIMKALDFFSSSLLPAQIGGDLAEFEWKWGSSENQAEEGEEDIDQSMRTARTSAEEPRMLTNSEKMNFIDTVKIELAQFRQIRSVLKRDEDLFNWWSGKGDTFPKLFEAARILFAISATSVSSERVFSGAGQIYGKKRVNCASIRKRTMAVGKQKNSAKNINSRLTLVMKSGKYCLGYKSSLKSIRKKKAKLVIPSNKSCRKSEVQYYAMLGKIGVHEYQYRRQQYRIGNGGGKLFRVSMMCVIVAHDSDILRSEK